MTAPTAQSGKGKWISFRLTGAGNTTSLTLPINPEELQLSQPGRLTTTQTLKDAFQDIADVGVAQLMLQGTTGWRKRPGFTLDGFQTAKSLYQNIFLEFYRRIAVDQPSVQLLLIDGIDDYTWQVSMDDFQMTRNNASSLLFRYMLSMTVLRNASKPAAVSVDVVAQMTTDTTTVIQRAVNTASGVKTTKRRTYKVQSGDSLWSIAAQPGIYNNGSKDMLIAQANHIKPPYTIYPGQILVIP